MNEKNIIKFPYLFVAILFISLFILSSSIAIFFKYKELTADITNFVVETHNISKTLITMYSDAAGLAYTTKSTYKLVSLFHQQQSLRGIKEIFFVLDNGTIVAHSDEAKKSELNGNIANDEFTYNIDMILYPHSVKSGQLFINDYFMPDITIPFSKEMRTFIKRFIYKDIDTNSWLVSKAVFINGKSVGTANCIIVKEPVYQIIDSSFNEIMIIIAIICGVSFFTSLIAGVIVYTRQKKVYRTMSYDTGLHFHEGRRQFPHTGIREAIPVKE
ncbi:MAG: hypothetical protein KBG92_00940 [Spirochaetes bacterium]|jgi:hypothetical protein|nr:hypothetical protein [Spirochaetota bacterium]MBP8986343.1 hypothetical protein [Spirochaetota bacterium]HOE19558.1 hypothetical protein [Spirochaetota bacterium]HQL42410.1 hypothetical protein [Spirochaetota bacterium]